MQQRPIYLFTDFGYEGPYVGLMHAAVARQAPGSCVVDLQHDAPAFRPSEAGRLLAAQLPYLPSTSVVVAVVDPGVGTDRRGLVVETKGAVLVGPDNGLLSPMLSDAVRVSRLGPGSSSMSVISSPSWVDHTLRTTVRTCC